VAATSAVAASSSSASLDTVRAPQQVAATNTVAASSSRFVGDVHGVKNDVFIWLQYNQLEWRSFLSAELRNDEEQQEYLNKLMVLEQGDLDVVAFGLARASKTTIHMHSSYFMKCSGRATGRGWLRVVPEYMVPMLSTFRGVIGSQEDGDLEVPVLRTLRGNNDHDSAGSLRMLRAGYGTNNLRFFGTQQLQEGVEEQKEQEEAEEEAEEEEEEEKEEREEDQGEYKQEETHTPMKSQPTPTPA